MPELLLELGCEELPAHSVRRAYTQLQGLIAAGLKEAGIDFQEGNPPIGTPRRLIVHFADVEARQPDSTKEMRGPGLAAAFDGDGNPTKALEGFCRGAGFEPNAVERRDGYVWIVKSVAGRDTREVLSELLPDAIRKLTFDKTMRWGSGRMRFARPIRWILASFDGEIVSFDVEGVESGKTSRGHRFYAPEAFEAKTYNELVNGLIARKVEPDPDEREKMIRDTVLITANGEPQIDPALLDENVFLTEWPTPIEGRFRPEFLELPEPVLITAMAKHEKMFPIRGSDGKLVDRYIFVRNSGDDETVRNGTAWVLNARFNDAKFFFDEDKKHSLDDFLARLDRIVFQEKLGTLRQRADRLAQLSEWIAAQTGASAEEAAMAGQAGLYAKADLSSGLVSELASLQGAVGGEYAKRQGMPGEVAEAIATHYDPSSDCRTGARVALADQIDKLAGYLGIGLAPTGSSDPFALRRAATMIADICWQQDWDLDVSGLLDVAATGYAQQSVSTDSATAKDAAKDIFLQRYEALFDEEKYDHVAAASMADHGFAALAPVAVRRRLGHIKELARDPALIQTCSRPLNILKAAHEKGVSYEANASPDQLDKALLGDAAANLIEALNSSGGDVTANVRAFADPINAFFDQTMVMSNDENERTARLSLVAAVCRELLKAGDLTKIVIEGN